MAVLTTIGYILLFILCLSVLIVVHELGHLAMAKAFNVYCLDFSIGFGPALFHRKRKNGETYFSIRAFPLGGFVSMYGEGVELPEGVEVDPSRSFQNIKKWKRIIILFAGVFNNALLAILIFFISEAACIQKSFVYYQNESTPESICFEISTLEGDNPASKAGMKGVEWNEFTRISTGEENQYLSSCFLMDKEALLTYNGGAVETVAAVIRTDTLTYNTAGYENNLRFYKLTDQKGENIYDGIDFRNAITPEESISVTFTLDTVVFNQDIEGKNSKGDKIPHVITINVINDEQTEKRIFEKSGVSFYLWERYNSFGEAVGKTFQDFGTSASAIVRAIGGLFTSAESWKQVGGIVSIGVQTTNILQNMGIGRFLYVWGLISVNLAIINLLPFPGLDGWQILVLAVELIAHKEIPEKVKNIVSAIGLVLLLVFAGLILFKDIIGLF